MSPFDRLRPGKRKNLAFTLVELLVVVAIIALLISILLPSLTRAKAIARMVKCSTNQYAIGRAAHMYATENNDYVPRDASYHNFDPYYLFFAARFSPYVGGPDIAYEYECDDRYLYEIFKDIPVYRCPSFIARYPDYVLTYVSNGYNFKYPTKWGTPTSRLDQIPVPPAEVGYIFELDQLVLPSGKPGSGESFGMYDVLGQRNSDGTLGLHFATFGENGRPCMYSRMIRFDDNRHFGRTTIVFFDGHAESRNITAEEMPSQLVFPKK